MNQIKVAFFDTKPYDRESFDKANEKFGFKIKYFETKLNAETARLVHGFDAVCVFVNDDIDAEAVSVLESNKNKLIAMRCAGYNNVDLKAAWNKIHVSHVPAYSPHSIAEHAAALLLTLTRRIHYAYNRVREGNFTLNGLMGRDLHEKYVGIVGTGRIGKIAGDIFRGFGMHILAYDKYPDEEWAKCIGAEYMSLDDLCKNSDIISLHSPLTVETRYMINEQRLSLMKPGVVIINTSRGALIDTKALIQALKKGELGGAGLDVYEEEEDYFFEDCSTLVIKDDILSRLLTFPNVIITGHQAFFTTEAMGSIAQVTLNNIKEYVEKNIQTNGICYNCSKNSCGKASNKICW